MGRILIRRARLLPLAMLLVLVSALPALAQSVSSLPKPTDYVSDFAHVMSPAVIHDIDVVCGQVDHEAHAQIAVVTVNSLDGEPVAMYAVDLYQKWGLGAKSGPDESRGVLILIAVKDRKRFISTGYGLEGILPDALVGQIGREMVPMLRANNFDGALALAVGKISQIIAADAGVTLSPLPGAQLRTRQAHIGVGGFIGIGVVILLILLFLFRFGGSGLLGLLIGMFFSGWGGGGGFGGGGFGGGMGGGGGNDGGDGGGGDGFDGFGGGSTGGGGAGGSW